MAEKMRVEFILNGKSETVGYEPGDSLLDTALRHGLNPPYSCMEGVCASCGARLKSGEVDFPDDTILSDEEVQEGKILTCRAKPKPGAALVVIDYDAF